MKSSSTTYLDFDGVLSSSQEAPLTTGVESSMNVVELVLKQCSKSHESKKNVITVIYLRITFIVNDEALYM